MTTHNQKVVAEALRLARDVSFHTGFRFLMKHMRRITVKDEQTAFEWFVFKCIEHQIVASPEARDVIFARMRRPELANLRNN